jgi:anti-sigma regulatory factor (Ser/Thr protein kinase)
MGVRFSGQATRVVPVEEGSQVGQVRREALTVAEHAGFGELDAGRVALAATELATNVLRHGHGGRVLISLVQGAGGQGVELCAIDQGPGFSLARCLPDGYSTAGSQGQGLGAIKRQSAVFDAWCDDVGAIVLARIYAEHAHVTDLPYGAVRVPMRHEYHCGDGWHLAWDADRLVAAMVDGLGHGEAATEAADAGTAELEAGSAYPPDELIDRMHVRMARTRGGAVAVFCQELATGRAQFAGIGNISATVVDGTTTRGLPSHPGIVGGQYRRTHAFNVNAPAGTLLVMHSDGLQARWSLGKYEGLQFRHPALVVALLLRDFDRGRDDTGIIAVRLGGGA